MCSVRDELDMIMGVYYYYVGLGVSHMVPLGDVDQHTLPCSVIGQCRVSHTD